jgi:hypothetical protein
MSRKGQRLTPAQKKRIRERVLVLNHDRADVMRTYQISRQTLWRVLNNVGQTKKEPARINIDQAFASLPREENGTRLNSAPKQDEWLERNPPPKTRVGDLRPEAVEALQNFEVFCDRYFGQRLFGYQRQWIDLMMTVDHGMVNVHPRSGKPLSVDTLILMGNGTRRRLGDLQTGDWVITAEGRPRPVTEVFEQGQLPCVRIVTHSGREVVAATDHPFLTPQGWKKAGELEAGTSLALVPTPTTLAGEEGRPVAEFALAGYLTGDGDARQFRIACNDPEVAEHVVSAIEGVGLNVTVDTRPGKCPSYRMMSSVKWSKQSSPRRWLEARGLTGTSHTKRVPDWVFSGNPTQIGGFLAAYFACDGTVTKMPRDKRVVEFYSVNRELLTDVQHLLMRLGITSTLREKRATYKARPHTSWRLVVNGQESQARFAEMVPVPGVKGRHLKHLRRSNFLPELISDEITNIEPAGLVECRCITVADDHTYTANDFVTHNTEVFSTILPCWLLAGGGYPPDYYQDPNNPLRDNQVMLVSKAEDQARKNFIAISARLTMNDMLLADFGRFKDPDLPWQESRGSLVVAGRQRDILSGDFSLTCIGARSAVLGRGGNWILLDDPADTKNTKSPQQTEDLMLWVQTEIFTRLEPGGRIFVMGAHLPVPFDLYSRLADLRVYGDDDDIEDESLDRPKLFTVVRQPAVLDWNNKKLLSQQPDGRFTWAQMMQVRARVGAQVWEAAYMQNPQSSEIALCQREWIYGNDEYIGCLDKDRGVGDRNNIFLGFGGSNPPVVRVCSVDPHPVKASALIVADVPIIGGIYAPALVDMTARKLSTKAMCDTLADLYARYRFDVLIMEENAAKFLTSSKDWEDLRHIFRGRVIHQKTQNNKNDPEYGKQTLAGDVERGYVRIPYGTQEARNKFQRLIDELLEETHTDDFVMALWFIKWNLRILQSQVTHGSHARIGKHFLGKQRLVAV